SPLPTSQDKPREVRYLRHAIDEALRHAGIEPGLTYPGHRVGIMLGTTLHGMRAAGKFLRSGKQEDLANFLAGNTIQSATQHLQIEGFSATACSACSSSLGSVAMGIALLRAGQLDLVVAGGYDTISEYVYGGFNSLRLVSPGTLRPFTRDRQGMKLAEGYGIVVLERAENAARRRVHPLATILGYGESADAHHLTQPHPQGEGAARAMSAALAAAGVTPQDIDMIACHATGTPDNDAGEYAALSRVFGADLPRVPVVAFKSHLGHTLGAAGAVELILSALSIRDQIVPACANVRAEDLEFPGLNVAVGSARPAPIRNTLNTSLGFGGANTCMVLGPAPAPVQKEVQAEVSPAHPLSREEGRTDAGSALADASSNAAAASERVRQGGPYESPTARDIGDQDDLPTRRDILHLRTFHPHAPAERARESEGQRRSAPVDNSRASQKQQVFITGVGVVLPGMIGNDAFAAAMDATDVPRIVADTGPIPESDLADLLNARRVRRMSDYVKLSLAAAMLACRDAGIADIPAFAATCSAALGSTHGSSNFSEAYYSQIVREGIAGANPVLFAEGVPNAAAAHLSLMLSLKGPCQTVIGTRTAGLDALHLAATRIASGEWDRAIIGAAEEYCPLVNAAYGHWGLYAGHGTSSARSQTRPARLAGPTDKTDFPDPDAGSEVLRRAGSNVEGSGSSEYLRSGVINRRSSHNGACSSGFAVGCGAVMLVLESARSFESRGISPRGRIVESTGPIPMPTHALRHPGEISRLLGNVQGVLGSGNGTWIDRLESSLMRRHEGVPYASLSNRVAETFSVMPLAGIAALLLTGGVPGRATASQDTSRIERVGILASDYTRIVSAAAVAVESMR
ncbi:MAG TPA: beta-ketoacyl-[acyl-carrier-protein] synthase family protein, partial [Humisphaera sp.]|nr:beta-ketoacyl-[acyl-carrier-protein] synthase family protein [Humisphaera sp.]